MSLTGANLNPSRRAINWNASLSSRASWGYLRDAALLVMRCVLACAISHVAGLAIWG